MVHEVEHRQQITVLDPLQIEERVAVWVFPEHSAEEGRAGGEDHLVRLQLLLVAGQRDIEEVLVLPQFTECTADVALKVVPTEAKLFR